METKDWIIMLVPIAINGICLYIFQQILIHKFKKMEKKTDYRQEILREFLRLLQDFYEKFRIIRNVDQSAPQNDIDFSSAWNMSSAQIQKVLIYYDTHQAALISLEKPYNTCIHKYQHMIDVLRDGTIPLNEGLMLTEQCRKDFCDRYWEMDKLIKDCLAQCEKQILQFR